MNSFLKRLVKNTLILLPESIRIVIYPIFRGKGLVNPHNVKNFNDFINMLKIKQRHDSMVSLQDKVISKEIISSLIPELHFPKTIDVYTAPEEFEKNRPKRPYVLKTNNGCGLNYVVVNESDEPSYETVKNMFSLSKLPYGLAAVEWTYQHIEPKVFTEEYLSCANGLNDYKVYVVKGKARMILVCLERWKDPVYIYYDPKWQLLNIGKKDISRSSKVERPKNLSAMLKYAEKIAAEYDFCRVDFYVVNDAIYFGEVCFYPEGGYIDFVPPEFNRELYLATVVENRAFDKRFYEQ